MKVLSTIVSSVILFATYWPMDDISIVGNFNPQTIHIGEDVILSCQVINCRSSNLIVHLYKWESSGNKSLYIHNSTKQPSIQESYSGDRDKNRTQKRQYINGYLEVTLVKVEVADAGQYVCALTCEDVCKEDTIEMIPRGIINASVGQEVILPCPLFEDDELFYLKMQWTRISHGKRQTIYSYLLQNTCAVVYSEDTLGHRCSSSNGSSSRVWFGEKYRQKAEVFKGSELGNKNGYLKLKNIQEKDAGTYLYSVKSNLHQKCVILQLSVQATNKIKTKSSPTLASNVDIQTWRTMHGKRTSDQDPGILSLLLSLFILLLELFSPKVIALLDLLGLFVLIIELRKLQKEVGSWAQPTAKILNREKMGPPEFFGKEENIFPRHLNHQQTDKELQELKCELEWRRACSNAEIITLDADSAHLNLSIDINKKSFTYEPQPLSVSPHPQRFDGIVSVLGNEGFSSGKHYWTVDIGGSSEWDLGVARRSIQRKGQFSISPKEGFWVLGRSGMDYWAKTDPWTRVVLQKKPRKIGVYLTFQPKEVTFFNVVDWSVLFVFRNCSFKEEIFPFFKNTQKGTTVAICSINEEKV